jgi:hypothetical protein
MKLEFLALASLVGLLASQISIAGSTDGLNLLIITSKSGHPYIGVINSYFESYSPGNTGADCRNTLLNVADVEYASTAHKIQPNLNFEVAKNKKQRAQLSGSLRSFRDKFHPTGFDAALIIDARAGYLHLVGVSADQSKKVYTSSLPLTSLGSADRVKQAMCESLVRLPVLTEP